MKRSFFALAAVLVLCLQLFLCSSCTGEGRELPLLPEYRIPENGIVEKAVFEELKKSGGSRQFSAESDGIRYTYTVFGERIGTPKDEDLSISFVRVEEEKILNFLFSSTKAFSFPVTLSLELDESWDTSALCCLDVFRSSYDPEMFSSVVTGTLKDGKTVLNFSLPETAGSYEVTEKSSEPGFTCREGECVLMVDCSSVLLDLASLSPEKREAIPDGGIILKKQVVSFKEGESVFDILKRTAAENKVQMEFAKAPGFNTIYIQGIHNLYEFDGGETSGWMYSVNGVWPDYGCSGYTLHDGDTVVWSYTCDLGRDVGAQQGEP